MRDDFNVWLPLAVRWADMDCYGHVNNAKYFTYCESARILYFEQIAIDDFRQGNEHGPAVVTATCNFRQQAHYPAELEVGVRASHVGRSSFTLDYGIFHAATEDVVADGSSVVVWIDYGVGKSVVMPQGLKERIAKRDGLS